MIHAVDNTRTKMSVIELLALSKFDIEKINEGKYSLDLFYRFQNYSKDRLFSDCAKAENLISEFWDIEDSLRTDLNENRNLIKRDSWFEKQRQILTEMALMLEELAKFSENVLGELKNEKNYSFFIANLQISSRRTVLMIAAGRLFIIDEQKGCRKCGIPEFRKELKKILERGEFRFPGGDNYIKYAFDLLKPLIEKNL